MSRYLLGSEAFDLLYMGPQAAVATPPRHGVMSTGGLPLGARRQAAFAIIDDVIAVRDSKRPAQTPLVFTRDEIAAMLAGAKKGTFDHLA